MPRHMVKFNIYMYYNGIGVETCYFVIVGISYFVLVHRLIYQLLCNALISWHGDLKEILMIAIGENIISGVEENIIDLWMCMINT